MGAISFEKLSEAMKLGKLGEQVVLKSRQAFERIEYKRSEAVSAEEYYVKKAARDWSGWALAYYQWYTGKTFSRIHEAVSIQEILYWYPTFHEADVMKFVTAMNERLQRFYADTNLKRIRKFAGLSQNELSAESGVPLRQIQLFEQRRRDINKTQAINFFRLSKVLGCKSEDLLEL